MTHTPAPWKISNEEHIYIWGNDGEQAIAHVFAVYNLPFEANARLIAAAPELLTALETMLESFVHNGENTKGNKAKTDVITYNPDVKAALNTARAAIKKAKAP